MGKHNDLFETSHAERTHIRMRLTYKKETCQKQLFMQDLKDLRRQVDKNRFRKVRKMIGPTWYQVLSVHHRQALDTLESSIYQDLLEGRPRRVTQILKILGIHPGPIRSEIEQCEYLGRKDPKEMLAQMFLTMFGHPIDVKRSSYCLNARLVLSSILYLGMKNLIELLQERFRPDDTEKVVAPKIKPKPEPPLPSPYLQKMEAPMYLPSKPKQFEPLPLPNLDVLNEPFEEYHVPQISSKPPPLPPPPPPPKKRLPRSYCDKLAGVMTIDPHTSYTGISMKSVKRTVAGRRSRSSKSSVMEVKRTLGFDITTLKKRRTRKPKAPNTGQSNAQYVINGIFNVRGRTVYVLGNVSILPPEGILIHGGFKPLGSGFVNIHCGIRGLAPPSASGHCDCVKTYYNDVFDYLKQTKCVCGHYYDYGHEDTFPTDEIAFFHKPEKDTPYRFDYGAIYNIDGKSIHVEKEFKKIWETESLLQKEGVVLKEDPKERMRRMMLLNGPCIGENSKPVDYLRCALRMMRGLNVAARLPDIHLVPELVEWMRRRIHGPISRRKKDSLIQNSEKYWAMLRIFAERMSAHITPQKDARFLGHSNWRYKFSLNKDFIKFTDAYKLKLFRAQARVNNMLWPSMYQAKLPDKKFREIYFSYLYSRPGDLTLMHPYTAAESLDRAKKMALNRYCCPPAALPE